MGIFRQILLICVVCCFLDQVYSVSARIRTGIFYPGASVCRSSETCVSIHQCPSLRRNRLVAPFLRETCGTEFGSHKICCPSTSLARKRPSKGNFNECGKSKKVVQPLQRVVGGTKAKLGNWPWMVALYLREERKSKPIFVCGASLISNNWVITAAHCVQCKNNQLLARLGDLNINETVKEGASPITSQISRIVAHPEYKSAPATNDIALIKLKKSVTFTENLRPICLLSGQQYLTDEYYNQKHPFISGWGSLKEGVQQSTTELQETTLNVTALKTCAQQYSNLTHLITIDEKIICASGYGKDACQGDSGGPLMFYNGTEARFYLGGIVSGGEGCARENFSGVYTKVAQYISWINKVTRGNF